MKHLSFILVLLLVSVATTACINNFAVQELNNNAKVYMDKGDVESAICRLKSSLELDSEVWETHYNLATAYFNANKFQEAQQEYQDAIKINPELADAYYSLAVAYESHADFLLKNKEENESANINVEDLFNSAISNYEIYIGKISSEQEIAEVQDRIASIKSLLVGNRES